MGAAIEKSGGFALVPSTFDEVMRWAEMIAKSDLVPPAYKNKPGNVMVAAQMGAELGLAPLQAVQNIAVINGRPGVWGDAMLALVQSRPDCEDVIETPPTPANKMTATCTVKRRGRSDVTQTFSQEDAQKAQLWGKQGPWQQYPKRMLQLRARAFALRDSFADVLRGIGMAEEIQDIPAPATKVSMREQPRAAAEPKRAAPAAELPPHNPETGEVIDMVTDPADYVMKSGKHQGKRLGDLESRTLHWYAEEFTPRSEEGELVKAGARAILDARKAEKIAAELAERAKVEADDGWGMSGGAEAEAEAQASANDE